MRRFVHYALVFNCFIAFTAFCADHRAAFSNLVADEFRELNTIRNSSIFPGNSTGGGHANVLASNHAWNEPTPSQPQGPFYPIKFPSEIDTDLTIINDGPRASGTVVHIQGQVMNKEGQAIKNALIEAWQANAWGRYNHPEDTNLSAPLDPHFQDYGAARTDDLGQYIFTTIVPGPYPASGTWWRPPHVHIKITAPGYKETITQLYFDGSSFAEPVTHIGDEAIGGQEIDRYNRNDLILNRLPEQKRAKLIVRFQDVQGMKLGVFNIYLKRL